MGIYDLVGNIITPVIHNAIPHIDKTVVKTKTLNGGWHIQHIGAGSVVVNVKASFYSRESKDDFDGLYSIGASVKVVFENKTYIGMIDEVEWERMNNVQNPYYTASFDLLVTEGGV